MPEVLTGRGRFIRCDKKIFLCCYPLGTSNCVLTGLARGTYNRDMSGINGSIYSYMRDYRAKNKRTVAFVRGRKKTAYGRFFRRVDRVAGGLAALGVKKGDVVMIATPTIQQGVTAFYAVSRLGAIASMIHPLMERGEFDEAVREQRPKVVFLSDINYKKLGKGLKDVKKVLCPFLMDVFVGLPGNAGFTPCESDGSEPAVYMRSGGTSGVAKTVVLSAAAVNALPDNLFRTLLNNDFGEKDRMLVALPMFHGFGLLVGIHAAMSTSMAPVLVPVFNVRKVIKAIAANGVTTMIAVPRMIAKLLSSREFAGENVVGLRNVYVGGDTVDAELENAFDRRMKEAGAKCFMSPGYGLTETGSVSVLSPVKVGGAAVGKPLDGMECRIVDEDCREVPFGDVGELWLAGNQLMLGYLDDPEGTAEAFAEADGKKWVRTGDYFRYLPDGTLFFMGRKKRLIKISGMNVYPVEIERVASELPYVTACAAAEVRDNDKPYIALFVEGDLTEEQKKEIKKHIVYKLSRWHEPKFVICMKELPRTNVGKTDYKRLNDGLEIGAE